MVGCQVGRSSLAGTHFLQPKDNNTKMPIHGNGSKHSNPYLFHPIVDYFKGYHGMFK